MIQHFPYLEIDEIYNLACPKYLQYITKIIQLRPAKTTVHGVINMLGLAKRVNAKIFSTASPSEVYGDPEQHPQREDYWGNVNPIGIRSCYDEGKLLRRNIIF